MKYSHITAVVAIPIVLIGGHFAWNNMLFGSAEPIADKVEIDPNILLPDLVPLPVRDLKIEKDKDGKVLLYFSTTYYNQGRGPVEMRIDDVETDIAADVERNVMQRVYLRDGGYEDHAVGTFLWHQEHSHYHFTDFVEYDLEAEGAPAHPDLEGSRIKSTFCLRDVSKVDLPLPNRVPEAVYTRCGKDMQGVSVGWGDTYYYDYPAQNIDISDLSSGTYRFTQTVNPELRMQELEYDNNTSSVSFKIDMEHLSVEVLEETPANAPPVEHVHLEQPFGI